MGEHPQSCSEELARSQRVSAVLNGLLRISLLDISLEETLDKALEELLSIPWLAVQAKGGIFLTDKSSGSLVLKAQKGFGGPIRQMCREVPLGCCLCGRAALSKELVYAACLDERHENRYEGIEPHGHYAVPIMDGGSVEGVLILYLDEGHGRDERELEFLRAVTDVLAGIIKHKRTESEKALLQDVALAVGAADDIGSALRAVLARVCVVTGWACGDAWLPSSDKASLEFAAAWFPDNGGLKTFEEASATFSFQPGIGLPGRAWAGKRSIWIEDVTVDSNFSRAALAKAAGLKTGLGVPVSAGSETVAVLCFYLTNPKLADERIIEVVAAAGAQLGAGILHKLAEEELRRSRASLAEAQGIAGIGSWELDLRTNRLRWSNEVYRIFGYPPSQAPTYEAFLATIHPEEKDMVMREMVGRLEQGGFFDLERRAVRPDGTQAVVHEIGRCILGTDGKPLRYGGTVQDISERRRLEEQLRHSQKMDAVGRLAGGVAHDFNNLLTAIIGYSEFLLSQISSGQNRADVEEIRKAAQRAAALTRQLLTFSRVQAITPKMLDLNAIVEGMRNMLRRLIGERIELDVRPGPLSGRILADSGQIEQVVMNLAVNARDAMPDGGKLTLATAEQCLDSARSVPGLAAGRYMVLSASDTGIGMDAKTKGRIFEPFFTTKAPGKGTGLGLSVVFGIIKQSKGAVLVESEPGKGARFQVFLPLHEAPAGDAEAGPDAQSPKGGAEAILLVEDDDAVRAYAERVLLARGYSVLSARSAEDALALVDGHPISLLLTDLVMPGMGGVELAKRLRTSRPELGVLCMSGYAEELAAAKVCAPGIPELDKPFAPDDLARKVREALDGPRAGGDSHGDGAAHS